MLPTTTASILCSPDVLHLVCQYQSGMHEDILPFRGIYFPFNLQFDLHLNWGMQESPMSLFQTMADTFDGMIPPWLSMYSIDRLGLLFDGRLEHLREPILLWAAYVGRLDVLVWADTHYGLGACSENLLVAAVGQTNIITYLHSIGYRTKSGFATQLAAIHGHLLSLTCLLSEFQVPDNWLNVDTAQRFSYRGHRHILEYLVPRLTRNPPLLCEAMMYVATYSDLEIAKWLHSVLVCLHPKVSTYDHGLINAVYSASQKGSLDVVQWLLQISDVDNTELTYVQTVCLNLATGARQRDVVDWIVPRVSPTTILHAYLLYDMDGSMLSAVVDPNIDIEGQLVSRYARNWSFEKTQIVFDTLALLKQPSSIRTVILKQCLFEVITHTQLETIPYYVKRLTADEVREILYKDRAMHVALYRHGGDAMLDVLEALDIHFSNDEMDDQMYTILRQTSNKKRVPMWLQQVDDQLESFMDRIAHWFLKRRGGRVAVLGRLLVRLAHGKKTIVQFNTLFRAWSPLVNEAERIRVFKACLEHTSNADMLRCFDTLVPSNPAFFVPCGKATTSLHSKLGCDCWSSDCLR
ncbi:Aste57867_3460 [Aphanomyces stellatus]|uniref:Aste57867_3460 protein n=1 Tax=Aphanomyces stellatus TaxID=120398 RepID=A0A485KF79_9STRA|nr:hypothetical protein As57867_003450 [Aphanomyces stellatus]VFT80626.1 Aste57867_3460 [Aphanomyces stellatus]